MVQMFNRWIDDHLESTNMTTIYRLRLILDRILASPSCASVRMRERICVSPGFVMQLASDLALIPLAIVAAPQ